MWSALFWGLLLARLCWDRVMMFAPDSFFDRALYDLLGWTSRKQLSELI